MAQPDGLEFDEDLTDAIKRNPVAALVIEVRYLRRDTDAQNGKLDKMNDKVDKLAGKQCPCPQVTDQGRSILQLQTQRDDNKAVWAMVLAIAAIAISTGISIIELIRK